MRYTLCSIPLALLVLCQAKKWPLDVWRLPQQGYRFASWKSIVWVLTLGVFCDTNKCSERGGQIPNKKNLSAFCLYSASSIQNYFLGKLDHVPQIAVMLENLYSKTPAIALFPGIERCDLPPSFILASVCSSRRCYERLDHGLDSFPFFSRSLALFPRNALRI